MDIKQAVEVLIRHSSGYPMYDSDGRRVQVREARRVASEWLEKQEAEPYEPDPQTLKS